MSWFSRKVELNKAYFKRRSRSRDPSVSVNVIPDWLSKIVKELVTIPLAIASTIFTHSKYLIIGNLFVVLCHLLTYLYGFSKEGAGFRKSFIGFFVGLVSVVALFLIINHYVPHLIIANEFMRLLFKLNIWASAVSLFLSFRSFFLSLWFSFVYYLVVPVVRLFRIAPQGSNKPLKCLYKDIFFFRRGVACEAQSSNLRFLLDQFMFNYSGTLIVESKNEKQLAEAAQDIDHILKFLVKKINKKHYSLFGFLVNQSDIEARRALIDKLLNDGHIEDTQKFIQLKIRHRQSKLTQINELIELLDDINKPNSLPASTDPAKAADTSNAPKVLSYGLPLFRAFRNLNEKNLKQNIGECRRQLEAEKNCHESKIHKLEELMPRQLRPSGIKSIII